MAIDEKTFRVLVIGGGPGGLLVAHALQKQGAIVTVFEQATSLDARPRDWNFGIYWAQGECLPDDVASQVAECQVDDCRAGSDETMPIVNGETEELLKAMPTPNVLRLARRKFLRLISKGIDVQYGKRLTKVESDGLKATAFFEDGTSETGDLLIGADGAHSQVRDFLVGAEKAALQPLPLVASVTIAKLPAVAVTAFKAIASRFMVVFHPEGFFNWIGLHNASHDSPPEEWEFMLIKSWRPSEPDYDPNALQGSEILSDLKQRAATFSTNLSLIWQSIPDGTKCWHNRLSSWLPQPWDNRNGTVTLLGDAAHPMAFHRGQGLNNAILDAGLLASCTKKHGFGALAIANYEEAMIPRAQEAVMTSEQNSIATHDWDTLMDSPLFKIGLKAK